MFLRAVMTRHHNPQTFPGFQKKTKNPTLSRVNLGCPFKKIVVAALRTSFFLFLGNLCICCIPDISPAVVEAPLLSLLQQMPDHCSGLCATEAKSSPKVTVVRMDAQQNGYDCGVWTLYALHTRVLRTVTKQDPDNIFQDMHMQSPVQTLSFRCVDAHPHPLVSRSTGHVVR